ncbi:MAG: HEAT repeat domain-containing protein, partial [Planctomycetota bacterium]
MNRWVNVLARSLAVLLCLGLAGKSASADAAALKALIVNGQNNHNWQASSPILEQILEQTGLFTVEIATSPSKGGDMKRFAPRFADYDVIILDYNGESWAAPTKAAFVEFVKSGGGVVVYHAANNSFPEWGEYNEIIGLGGWGGRDEKSGPYVRWRKGKIVRDMSPGRGGSHGPRHDFQVVIRDKKHPVTRGLPTKWMHAEDELYSQLRGPAQNLKVLATAYADAKRKGSGEHEPTLFTVSYGRGRVFHTVLGHVGRSGGPLPAMECVGFITTFQRGTEWAATGKVTQKVPEDFPTETEVRRWKDSKQPRPLDELLSDISKYEHGQSRRPLTELTEIMSSASGSAKAMKRIEKSLIDFLGSDATPAGKQFICRKLSVIGTKESVPTLESMLTEKATSPIEPADMARYALERIPDPAADKALRGALGKTSGKVKVGIINSLGERGDGKAVKQLTKLLTDPDREVAEAAISALGKIGGKKAAQALGKARSKVSKELYPACADAYLMCADKFLAKGDKKSAARIYKRLYVPEEPFSIRVAALRGMVVANPKKEVETVVGVLKGEDEGMQAAAIGLLREIPGPEMIKAVTAEFSNLSAAGQVQVLSALAGTGDRSVLPVVVDAAKSPEANVRIAALGALGTLGDIASVRLLAETAARAEGAEQQAARESLYRLGGVEIDKTILVGIPRVDADVRIELIRSVGERDITAGVGTLLKAVRDEDRQVRLEAWKVLKVVADEGHLQVLIGLMMHVESEAERAEAENTIAAVTRKIEDEQRQADKILAILPSIRPVKSRCSLLRVLGKIGGSGALAMLREALNDTNADVQLAAIRALSDWPTSEPADDLRKVARESRNQRHRILALRG